jgi:hypothetical protein
VFIRSVVHGGDIFHTTCYTYVLRVPAWLNVEKPPEKENLLQSVYAMLGDYGVAPAAVTQLTDPSYSADPIYRQISGHVLAIKPKNPTFM